MTRIIIETLGAAGDGVAHLPDAGRIFAPFALPGEEVEGEIIAGRMEAPKIATPVAERVAAPCPHFRRCGGCALQHAADDVVAKWKRQQIVDALAARGVTGVAVRPTLTSPPR